VFTSDGKLVGAVRDGFVEDPNWMEVYNADELGRLVVENKISFAFCGGHESSLYTSYAFRYCEGTMYCIVINGKIFLLNNWPYNVPNDFNSRLTPFEEFINQKE
jgi:hypothetical protein